MADVFQRVVFVKRCNFSWPPKRSVRDAGFKSNVNLPVDSDPAWRTSSLREASIGNSNSRGRMEVN